MDVLGGGLWIYVVLGALVALDSVVPVLPSEALVITASATSPPSGVVGVLLAAAFGAFVGDVLVHVLGRRAHGTRIGRWLRRRAWLCGLEHRVRNGGIIAVVVGGRFVPGGRTCVSFLTGVTRVRWRTYLPAAAAGSLLWAAYVTMLGWLGDQLAVGSAMGVGIGAGIGLVVGGVMRIVARRRSLAGGAGPAALITESGAPERLGPLPATVARDAA